MNTFPELIFASHWEHGITGDVVKISQNTKIIYHYRLYRYNFFAAKGTTYNEANATIAENLGLTEKTVRTSMSLLKRMGLIYQRDISFKKVVYTVYPLDNLNGRLINPKAEKNYDPDKKFNREDDYIEYRKIKDHNYKMINKIKDMKEKVVVITEEDFKNLRPKKKKK